MRKLHIKESFEDDYIFITYSINYLTYYMDKNDYGCDDYYVVEDTEYEAVIEVAEDLKDKLDKDLANGKYPGIWTHNIVIEAEYKQGKQTDVDSWIEDDVKVVTKHCYSNPVTDFEELPEYIPNVNWTEDEDTLDWFEQGVETYYKSK